MSAIPVIPDSAMCTHDDHAVDKGDHQQVNIEIVEQKDKESGDQQEHPGPVEEGQPIPSIPENVQPDPEFFPYLSPGRDNQTSIGVIPSIGRNPQHMIHQVHFSWPYMDRTAG